MVPLSSLGIQQLSRSQQGRRGVLLLIVLSMLTLFLLLGSTYLVVAVRARRVSQAFANRITAPAAAGPVGTRLVDQGLLTVLRGTTSTVLSVPNDLRSGEDLLGDKYGTATVTGEITGIAAYRSSNAFLTVTTTNLTPAPADVTELPGRIITLALPGLSVSTRILRATGPANAPSLVIAAGPTVADVPLSLTTVTAAFNRSGGGAERRIIINGREFDESSSNEPWDAFDNSNPLLTRILPSPTGGTPTVTPATILGTSPTLDVDNDGDGVFDSNFQHVGLPTFKNAAGINVQPRAAFLVVDLDGRINLNTHDDLAALDSFQTSFPVVRTDGPAGGDTTYPRYFSPSEIPHNLTDDDNNGFIDDPYCWKRPPTGGVASLRSIPIGFGSVAGISLGKSDVLRNSAGSTPRSTDQVLRSAGRGKGGLDATANDAQRGRFDLVATSRPLPYVGGVEGRYGGTLWDASLSNLNQLPRPGRRFLNDPVTTARERWTVELQPVTAAQLAMGFLPNQQTAQSYFTHPGRYGTPPDIKGRMRVWGDPKTGQPLFYKPYWDESARSRAFDNEVVDDPYEIDLTPRGARIATIRNQSSDPNGTDINNPFTAADLEGLLRFYDPDSPRLSRRLIAVNDDVASLNRLTLTTESWDTPAITGEAWREVIRNPSQTLLAAGVVNDFFAPETITGHRLDLNRPFHDSDVTEKYFDDLNSNGGWDAGEPLRGSQRRQAMARHIYSVLVSIASANGLTMNPDHARRLAQYAVNIVDFRDGDSIMTLFRYDPAYSPPSASWNPTEIVWGCERPEVLITETYAWHDRNTDDEAIGGSVRVPDGQLQRDSSFDQVRRPRGAFFVELASPWGAPAYEFDGANTAIRPLTTPAGSSNPFDHHRADILAAELVTSEDGNGNGHLDPGEDANRNGRLDPGEDMNDDGLLNPGEDRNGNGILDVAHRNRIRTGIDLENRVLDIANGIRYPVWRLVSIRGDVNGGTAFGTDPLSDAEFNPTHSVLDPSTPGSTASVDRAFYFAIPPPILQAQIPGGVFWQAVPSATPLTVGHFRVVGTNAPFDPGAGPCQPHVAGMLGPGNKPATLTEPLIDSTIDPYHRLMQEVSSTANMMTPDPALGGIAASWNTAINRPLDSYVPFPGGANVVSAPFTDTHSTPRPILMINGTHENFAVIHLQRLADPTRPWNDTVSSADYNPYVTVDAMPVDLNVVNSVRGKPMNDPVGMIPPLAPGVASTTANYDDPSSNESRDYGRGLTDQNLSIDRAGRSGTPLSDIWTRRVNATVTNLRDADAFRTSTIAYRGSPDPLPSPRPLPPVRRHTLTGQILGFRITSGGSDYDPNSPPTIDITGPGTGVRTRAVVTNGSLVAIDVIDGGSGYVDSSALTVAISGGGGIGASAIPIVGGKPPRWINNEPYAALFWPNRPFENPVEVGLVPVASPFHLTQRHSIDDSGFPNDQKFLHLPGFWETNIPPDTAMRDWTWRYVTGRFDPPLTPPSPGPFSLLDFVHVRSRFANLYPSVPADASNVAALLNLGLDRFPVEQLSAWREPGRINVNTIVDGEGPTGQPRGAWRALFGGVDALDDVDAPSVGDRLPKWLPDIFGPAKDSQPTSPVNSVRELRNIFRFLPTPPPPTQPNQPPTRGNRLGGFLDDYTNTTTDVHRLTDRHAYFRYQTMLTLADRVTTRSNVYAVWVTIGYFDGAGNEIQPIQRNRGFFVVDRSIPVAYERGHDHNVRDAIRLRRIIQ